MKTLFHDLKSFLAMSLLLHGVLWLTLRSAPSGALTLPFIEVEISQTAQSAIRQKNKSNLSQSAASSATSADENASDALSALNQILQNRIRYPARAAAMGWQGIVGVRVIIDGQGGIAELIFTRQDPHDDFNRAVSDALHSWKFDYPEGSEIPLTFRFILTEK